MKGFETIGRHTVTLSKTYDHFAKGRKTVLGTMRVWACDQQHAERIVGSKLTARPKPLQTVDPRIHWQERCPARDGWLCVHFSFKIVTLEKTHAKNEVETSV